MKNVISLYTVGKLVDNKLAVYPKKTETCSHYEQNVHLMLCQIFVFTMKRNISVDIKQTQRYCVNPFNTYGIEISKDLRNVAEELALFPNTIPGQKLCKRCKETAKENMKAAKNDCENNKDDQDSSYLSKDFDRSRFNSSAKALGFVPIKPVGKPDAVSYAQNKAKRMKAGLNERLVNVMEISNEELNESSLNDCSNCKDLERLSVLIKEKLEISSPRDQIKILTLTPESWSIKKTVQEFGVTEYKVKCARELKKERGILAEPKQKVGKALSGDVSEIVSNFYQQDEYSRCCPGMKDFVSVTKDSVKTKHLKRLPLLNIKELFLESKKEYPTVKIGFSKFCELRPKWVKTVNHSGMHSVCVCQYHQNVKLLISAIPGNFEYKDILSKVVCNIDLRKCMLHLCSDCPGKTNLNKFLT